eukprot:1158130-Pelagomonas_calceolata.AAC.17
MQALEFCKKRATLTSALCQLTKRKKPLGGPGQSPPCAWCCTSTAAPFSQRLWCASLAHPHTSLHIPKNVLVTVLRPHPPAAGVVHLQTSLSL